MNDSQGLPTPEKVNNPVQLGGFIHTNSAQYSQQQNWNNGGID
jgi:hypothetical protein